MPTPLNDLYHPYVAPHTMAAIQIYLRRYRFAARKLVAKNARARVLREMREARMRYPHPFQVFNLNRGFNQSIAWRGPIKPTSRRTPVPRPDVYVPRLPHLTHLRRSLRGNVPARQWVRDNLILVLAEHVLRNWDTCSKMSTSLLRQGTPGAQWAMRVNLSNAIITVPAELRGLSIERARELSPGLVLFQPS